MNRTQLISQINELKTFLCVGLDSDIRKIPACLLRDNNPVLKFNKEIIDATAPYCVAYKPNVAFYEAMGANGWNVLMETCRYIRINYPDKFIIADAKRGDIGNTAAMYARAFFEDLDVDAVTLAPYMGSDSVKPFLEYEGKWSIVLALTSNKSSSDFETFVGADGKPLYEKVLCESSKWASPEKMMFVVGATKPSELKAIRKIVPDNFLLVPGVGAQGGSLTDVCDAALVKGDCNILVNSSRGIIYASQNENFAEAAEQASRDMALQMSDLLK